MVEADKGYLGEPTKIRVPVDYATVEDKKNEGKGTVVSWNSQQKI